MQLFFRKPCIAVVATVFAAHLCIVLIGQTPGVPIPTLEGPIAVSSTSAPFLADQRNFVPMNLAKAGYVEEEFIISGSANVYNWEADGGVTIKTPNAPYATRILVRRPSNSTRFSGNVIVEILHSGRRFDWPMLWGYSREFFIENGDAWVGITMPNSIAGLKTFNAARYAKLGFANPSSVPCTPNGPPSEMEEGLRWDAISQVAALLKSSGARALGPAGRTAQAVFLTMQGGELQTYINAIHPRAVLSNGKPAYDGYLLKSPAAPVRINQCATAPGANDPRRAIRKTNVPVIAVVAQGEAIDAASFTRADSDAVNDKFRVYEIAGAGHIDKMAYNGFLLLTDQTAAVGSAQGTVDWPFNVVCDPPIPMMSVPLMSYALDSAFENLEQWARKGIPAPIADRLQRNAAGVATDAHGHGLGGVRNPYVEVPAAALFTNSNGPGVCREMGREDRFDAQRFQSLYPSPKIYSDKVAQAVERLVKERWLTSADAAKIKREALAYPSK